MIIPVVRRTYSYEYCYQHNRTSVTLTFEICNAYQGDKTNFMELIAGNQFCTGLEHGSRLTAIVNIRYQETPSENTAEK
jgi:hypothetical protein